MIFSENILRELGYAGHASASAPAKQSFAMPTAVVRARAFCDAIVGRTAIIADNSNLLPRSAEVLRLDYAAVLQALGGDELFDASIVVTSPPHQRPSQRAFYRLLRINGWTVRSYLPLITAAGIKENETAVDGEVRNLIRDAANSPSVNSIVLLGGDGGYTNAVRFARKAGKAVFVVGYAGTIHPALADAANDVATAEELANVIGRLHH